MLLFISVRREILVDVFSQGDDDAKNTGGSSYSGY